MLEAVWFALRWLFFWTRQTLGFGTDPELKEKCVGVTDSVKHVRAKDWHKDALGGEKDRFVLHGSTATGDLFVLDLTFTPTSVKGRLLLRIAGEIYTSAELDSPLQPTNETRFTSIVVGPVRLEVREPFRRWRVCVRGILTDSRGHKHFVRLNSWFHATSDECFFFANLSPRQLAAVAQSDFQAACSLAKRDDCLQWGLLRSRISVGDEPPTELDFRCLRLRTLSTKADDQPVIHEVFSAVLAVGDRIFLAKLRFPESSKTAKIGRIFRSDHVQMPVFDFSSDYQLIDTGKREYHLEPVEKTPFSFASWPELSLAAQRIQWDHNDTAGFALKVQCLQDLRLSWSFCGTEEKEPVDRHIGLYCASIREKHLAVMPLTHRACQDPLVAGGKGSNLAKLTTLQSNFTVPSGFVVTVAAFEHHLTQNRELARLVTELSKELKPGDAEAVGVWEAKMRTAFLASPLEDVVVMGIEAQLTRLFGPSGEQEEFAVRSSAVGEDGTELSSAGQLETFLQVSRDDIPYKVLECWASNYRREILNYRLQNAQTLSVPVAVVVQRMVTGGSAGVLFTNDPVKGDPSKLVINVVQGLGEALVSGQATPDEIVVDRTLQILSKPEKCDFADTDSVALCKVGIMFEEVFGGPQDVEFAVKDGHIYVLQTRNITNLDLETDWEFEHEFDAPAVGLNDLHSTANVGEVLAKPFTPLSESFIMDVLDRTIYNLTTVFDGHPAPLYRRVRVLFPCFRQRVFINLTETYMKNWQNIEKDRTPEYSLAGQKLFTKEMIEDGRVRFGSDHTRNDLTTMLYMLKEMLFGSRRHIANLKAADGRIRKLERIRKNDIAGQIELLYTLLDEVIISTEGHALVTMTSSFTYVLTAIFVRGSAEGDLNADMLATISSIYAANPLNPISGDVPKALHALAHSIVDNGHVEQFLAHTDPKAAIEFLSELSDSTGTQTRRFFDVHGHRGEAELMLQGVTWKEDPSQIVTNLKTVLERVQNGEDTTQTDPQPDAEGHIVDRLGFPHITGLKRRFFKLIVDQAHRGVFLREEAKSMLVYAIGAVRNACLRLGELLHEQGLLPDRHSVLFLTMDEVQELVKTRNPRIMHRLRRRQKVFAKQGELEYPLVSVAVPKPLDLDAFKHLAADVELHGTSVCEGKVVGRARVAKTLDEAFETQPGEILVTRYTDIGWSPLFPVIRGLVTEIGGLLSHGSVVAREYGLPCVIACQNATDILCTGDQILVDATNGVVKRLSTATELRNGGPEAK